MSAFRAVLVAAVVSGVVVAVASASGPPPPEPTAPQLRTVVAHGTGAVPVARPAARNDRSIARVVREARDAALPHAVNAARADAIRLARAAGITLGKPIGIERDVSGYGYGAETEGVYGPGQWCRTWRGRHRCHVPRQATVRITLTVAAS